MQEDLFGIFQPIVSADIDSLSDPSFRDWARRKLKEGTINNILVDLVRSGVAINTADALNLLNSHSASRRLFKGKPIITLTDLGLRPIKKFKINANGLTKNKSNPHGYLGVLSHVLMNRFCKGQSHNLAILNLQLPLFDYQRRNPEQLQFLDFKDDFMSGVSGDELVGVVKNIWSEASRAVGTPDFIESYYSSARFAEPLLKLVRVFAGVSVGSIFYEADAYEKWLWINAMLTWANAFINLAEGKLPRPTIYEIQALNRCLGMSGGRIDGVEVISSDKPSSFLGDGIDFDSIGQLACYLQRKPGLCLAEVGSSPAEAGANGAFRIIDWKFAIGDAVKVGGQFQRPMSPDEVKEKPIESHRMQVERYLTLGFLDELFACEGGFSSSSDFWNRETSIKEGLIVYLFPTSPPIIHKVALTAKERREVFVRDVVSHWEKAGPRSLIRGIDRQCRLLLSGRRDNGADRISVSDNDLIGGKDNALMPIIEVVNNHRVFLDGDKIIEDRNGKYVLHLERLVACIGSGAVKASSTFGLPRGGLICCPVHEDRTPSMSVRPQDGYFYCFARSCKISGRLALSLIPQEIQADVKPELWIRRKDLFKDLFVPDEHHNILEQAQLLLQGQFYDSEGERYVREQRGLDSDLAYEMGAGFGNSNVVSAILDQGLSLEELKKVGLIRFSSKVSSRKGLCPMLFERGLKLAEIKREIGKTADGKSTFGLPYFVLDGRITFPLKVRNRYANMYGRSVYPNAKVPHIKLSTDDSGIRHGAFNEEILYSDKCKEVIVAEGVFDAISVKQMFARDALAIIGTKNDLIVELLAQSGKDVAIALDNDPAGRADSERLKSIFSKSNKFKGKVRDFTQSFIDGLYGRELEIRYFGRADWRDLLDWDDWNTLLVKHGKWWS